MSHRLETTRSGEGEPSCLTPPSVHCDRDMIHKHADCPLNEWLNVTEKALDCCGERALAVMAIIIKQLCQMRLHAPCDGCVENTSGEWQVMGHDNLGRYSIWGGCGRRMIVGIIGKGKAQTISCPNYVER